MYKVSESPRLLCSFNNSKHSPNMNRPPDPCVDYFHAHPPSVWSQDHFREVVPDACQSAYWDTLRLIDSMSTDEYADIMIVKAHALLNREAFLVYFDHVSYTKWSLDSFQTITQRTDPKVWEWALQQKMGQTFPPLSASESSKILQLSHTPLILRPPTSYYAPSTNSYESDGFLRTETATPADSETESVI